MVSEAQNNTLPLTMANSSIITDLHAIRGHDLEGYVDGSHKCPVKFMPDSSTNENSHESIVNHVYLAWRKHDQLLLSCLLSTLTERVLARLMKIRLQLQTIKKGSLSMIDYLQKMKSIVDNLTAAAQPVKDDDPILYILSCLGPNYDVLVVSESKSYLLC
ncbi:hypothetical protein KY284_019968 [Solanum tuberosum]|nr:hypothetical protein KY284_019968 [Solanum tuberosum]